jgi:hypothetical protein
MPWDFALKIPGRIQAEVKSGTRLRRTRRQASVKNEPDKIASGIAIDTERPATKIMQNIAVGTKNRSATASINNLHAQKRGDIASRGGLVPRSTKRSKLTVTGHPTRA